MTREGAHTVTVDFWAGLELELTLDYEAPCAGNGGRGGWMLGGWRVMSAPNVEATDPGTELYQLLDAALTAAVRDGGIPEVDAITRGYAEAV